MTHRVERGLDPRGFPGAWLILAALLLAACTKQPPEFLVPPLSMTDPAFQNSVEAFTGAPIIGGNKVDILLNGEETFPAMVDAIRSAKKSVTFEAYIFRKSRVADELVEAFVTRCRVGVRVAVLLDAHGSMNVPAEYVESLRNAGCNIVPDFRPLRPWQPRRSNLRNHRRIVVVDGRVGFTGGYGIDEMWMGDGRTRGRWRETNVRVEGPLVQQLQAAFADHWREATGALLGGGDFYPYPPVEIADVPVRGQVVLSSPTRDNFALYMLFLQAVSSAQRSILISTPYLLPTEQISAALVGAAQRGVAVTVLVPSLITEKWIEYLVQESQREGFDDLLQGGIQLYEYHPGLLHTKAMVIDGMLATVGSMNLDNRSMGMNDELNVVMYDETVAKRLTDIFVEDLGHSRKITQDHLRSRGVLSRLVGLLATPFTDQF